jgi:hypothetical protein
MKDNMSDQVLRSILKDIKPNLKEGSIRNYIICIEKLHERVHGMRTFDDFEWLKDGKAVMEHIDKMNKNTQRNYLNSVLVFFEQVDDHSDQPAYKLYISNRDTLNKEFSDTQSKNKKTAKQEGNWITPDEFSNVIQTYEKLIKRHRILQAKADDIQKDELQRLQDYVLLRLYNVVPSRNDFADVQIINKKDYKENHNTETNYLVMSKRELNFVLHNWKTKRSEYDSRVIEIPPDLQKLLRAFVRKLGGRTHLFANSRGGPLTRNGLTKLFTRLFKRFFPNKNISTSLMRHFFLTNKYADVVEEMAEDQNNLGHSAETQKSYIVQ